MLLDSRGAFSWYRNPLTTQRRFFCLGQGSGRARVGEGGPCPWGAWKREGQRRGHPKTGRAIVEVTAVCSELRAGGRGFPLTGEQKFTTCALLAGTQPSARGH